MGYSVNTIAYLTRAAPSDMQWLTPDDAHKLGIGFVPTPDPEATTHASAPPAQPITENSQERAASATVLRYFVQWSHSGTDVEAMAGFYGQSVIFYGKETPTSKVMVEKRKFAERWPARDFTVRTDRLYVQCTDVCAVTGVVEWNVSSAERGVRSTGSANFVLKLAGNTIVSENGSVLSNHTDSLAPSPPAMAATVSQPPTTAFDDGKRDRVSYEQWYNSLGDGAYRSGALHYAANRSTKVRCNVGSDVAFVQGCLAARQRLQGFDIRRLTEADYRSGWTSL